jgi:two-component system, OmpR family, sensor kinase
MSLRARVLVGMAAIAVVLGLAALTVTQIIEAHLVDRIDQQLESTSMALASGPRAQRFSECFTEPMPPSTATDSAGSPTTSTSVPTDAAGPTDATTSTSLAPGTPGAADPATPETTGGARTTCAEGTVGPSSSTMVVVGSLSRFDVSLVIPPDVVVPLVSPDSGPEAPAPPDLDVDDVMGSARTGEPFTVGSDGATGRHRVRGVVNPKDEVLAVSQPLAEVDATMGRLVVVEAVATVAILGVLGLVAWWVIRHGVRPVKQMTATASAIAGGDLSHRVPEHDPDTEAGQLGTALNRMLGRIEHAFDERSRSEARLRQFVADASHELRTPVTTIRGYSELYESGGLDDGVELSEAMRRTRQEALRMGNLVDDMLLLARLDEGRELARQPVDVAALVRDAGRDARAVDPDRSVVTATQGPLGVLGDADRLRQVIANLVGNALVHTPSSARLDLRARRDGDRAVVEVADRGPGMPPEVVAQAFDRFFRADQSRSRHRGGSGLGLAIVQATAAAHGGQVSLHSTLGEGTTARLTLPLAPTDHPMPADG